ncbi:MAG: ACT domain-containing protein [Bryobacteraceae bacterium]
MRVARNSVGSPERVSPFAHPRLGAWKPIPIATQTLPYYVRFRVQDRPGIIATLASLLAAKQISLDAVLQLPSDSKNDLPFVITVEPSTENAICGAVAEMNELDFMVEPAFVMPMEKGL